MKKPTDKEKFVRRLANFLHDEKIEGRIKEFIDSSSMLATKENEIVVLVTHNNSTTSHIAIN